MGEAGVFFPWRSRSRRFGRRSVGTWRGWSEEGD